MTEIQSTQPAPRHTPGPWKAGSKSVSAPETEDRLGLDVRLYGGNARDNRANARLIAAAPELLEACAAMIAWDEAEKAARPWNEDGGKGWHERLDACALAFEKARAAIAKATGAQA